MVDALERDPPFLPDVYFGRGYGVADALSTGGTWITLADPAGAWQMPVVIAEQLDGLRTAIGPYGYAGVHVAAGVSAADAATSWAQALACLRDLRVVSLFLRFDPLDPASTAAATAFEGLTIDRDRTTYAVPVDDAALMWDRLRSSCRSRIRKARRHGYTATVRPAAGLDLEAGGDFRRLYESTMIRLGATSRYHFSDAYYAALHCGLGEGLLLAEVRDGDSRVVSACLLMRHDRRLHYHLAGSDPDDALMGSNNLMMWTAAEFAAEHGLEQFHLGGGRTESDGLARFKSTFGSREKDFRTGRAVLDPAAYDRLTRARAAELGTTSSALEGSGFFPAFLADGS